MRAPSLYSYFDSKFALYDAMFAQANIELRDVMLVPDPDDFEATFRRSTRMWAAWASEDPVRFQLLFQRTIPGFDPSEASYEIAREVFERHREAFMAVGLSSEAFDVWTAIVSGITTQQIANDPGGDRYLKHLDDVIDMYLDHQGFKRKPRKKEGKR